MNVIGFLGKAYHGKSECAKILSKHIYGHERHIFPFGGPLKKLASELGWDGKKDKKGRKILQALGTEVGRNIDPDYWVGEWKGLYHPFIVNEKLKWVIIDDVRFKNEAQMIRHYGGVVIKVQNPFIKKVDDESEPDDKTTQMFKDHLLETCNELGIQSPLPEHHQSEKEMDSIEVDHIINNVSDIPYLEAEVLKLFNLLKEAHFG